MSFDIGDTVDAYTIAGVVGRGGMGRVFQVEHSITRRVEAMKVVIGGRPDASEQAQRFLREIQLQASLSHPNIASVHHAFWLKSDLVLIMELVEGPSLQDLLEAGPIPLATAIDYACQALRALSHAHRNGVVHRDVSPGNILVDADGTVKLTDFGLAKALAGPRSTQAGEAMGSVYYASPEQLKGLPTVDERADVYSLGAVLYELVTGRPMFDADSLYDVMIAQIEQAPPPPAEIRPDIPPALNDLILTALSKDPARRFPSAEAFLDALEPIRRTLGGTTAEAARMPGTLGTGTTRLRNRLLDLSRAIRFPSLAAAPRTAAAVLFGALMMTALLLAVRYTIPLRSAPGPRIEVPRLPAAESFMQPEVSSSPPPPAAAPEEKKAEAGSPEAPKAAPEPQVSRSARRPVMNLTPTPLSVSVVRARVEPVPAEIPTRLTESPAPPSLEAVPTSPWEVAEVPARKPRHWLWRALGKIPRPRFRGKSARREAESAATVTSRNPPGGGTQP